MGLTFRTERTFFPVALSVTDAYDAIGTGKKFPQSYCKVLKYSS